MSRSVLLALLMFVAAQPLAAADALQFGFGKSDITPDTPLRLSGYANRAEPFTGVDEPLLVRAMAMQAGDDPVCVLVSVDTIGFPGTLTKSILERLAAGHGITRERFVVCCTHSHTAPEVGALSEMFEVPFTDEQKQATAKYRQHLSDQVVAAVDAAIEDLKPGRMFAGEGEATFADNRRVLTDGVWSGFGVNPNGPVDHRLPFLKITGEDGKSVRGILFNYACHCTTFGGDYNRVNGDWAGYAAKYLEAAHPGAMALCTIGTGADANPQRDSKRAMELAQAQGRQIADAINGLLDAELAEVTARPTASFGYAGLPIDRPTKQQLEESLKSPRRPVRVHAETMLDTLARMGRLPETYPMPIQVWRFGEAFAMVFLGGEVCVDYGLRIKNELASGGRQPADSQPSTINHQPVTPWVVAYANDVFGYVASERMRPEGGYEVDSSMIYYMLPGRWSTGTEEVILRRVHEMYESTGKVGPLSAQDALGTFTIPEGYTFEIVAAEPLIQDPVNMALGENGSLWVVEMGDYPRGKPETRFPEETRFPDATRDHPFEGPPGGTVKRLIDADGDGRYDEAVTFLDKLSFPTGVQPWKDGVLVSVAPDILFARDTDGDGRADEQQVLYTGFKLANPQHRVNGFVPEGDGWFQLASGDNNKTITSTKTGETLDMSGRDIRIHPESGRMEAITGRSQWCRTVDAQGNWFGNDNSDPLYHFVIEDRYLKRNPFVAAPDPKVHLTTPHRAPPVYPTSRTLDRFNDLFALNRFTSACSPYVWKAVSTPDETQVLICEPVHNLVSRIILEPDGVTFRGRRHEDEQESEFLASTDNWFRPVRVIEGADGSLLICDMYRMVIEHPQWIPEAWQDQLDLYAGHDMGRIYRLSPQSRPSALAATAVTQTPDARETIQLLEPFLQNQSVREAFPDVPSRILKLARHDDTRIRFQVALILGQLDDPRIADALVAIARRDPDDKWIRTAVLSSAVPHAQPMLEALLADRNNLAQHRELLEGLIATALGKDVEQSSPQVAALIAGDQPQAQVQPWQMSALASFLDALKRRGSSFEKIAGTDSGGPLTTQLQPIFAAARKTAGDHQAPVDSRSTALALLGSEPGRADEDVAFLASLLAPQSPVELQTAAVEVLARLAADQLPTLLLANWKQHSPALRQAIVGTLLSRDNWMQALAAALEAGNVPPADMDAATRQRLLTTWNGPVREAAARLYGTESQSDRADVVAAFDGVRELAGDPGRGAEVFKKTCSACHQHGGIGKDLAPQLANLTNKSTEALLTAILDPNRAVEQKYTGYVVVTADGRVLSGLIKSETGNSLTLAEPNGTEHIILRIDIEQMQATGKSFMPEGLEKDVTPQNLADVISFVQQAK